MSDFLKALFGNAKSWLSAAGLGAIGAIAAYVHGLGVADGLDPITALVLGGLLSLIKKLVDAVVAKTGGPRAF